MTEDSSPCIYKKDDKIGFSKDGTILYTEVKKVGFDGDF